MYQIVRYLHVGQASWRKSSYRMTSVSIYLGVPILND